MVSDRFTDATFAYQGGGRGLPFERIVQLERLVQGELTPDLTLLLDMPLDAADRRLAGRLDRTGTRKDRFEQERRDFFERVRLAYLARAEQAPQRMVRIDADASLGEVQRRITRVLDERVAQWT